MSTATSPTEPAGWSPVAAAADLPQGKVLPLRVAGRALALWRGESGRLAVWEDRCPHRGMRLSFGAVQRDRLICPYHGWAFDETGQCRHYPAHPGLKPAEAAHVRAFQAHAAGGYIWVGFTDAPFVSAAAIEALALCPVRSLHVARPADALRAALLAGGAVPVALPGAAPLLRDRQDPEMAILLAPSDTQGCMLHGAAIGGAGAAARLALNARLVALRLACEGARAA